MFYCCDYSYPRYIIRTNVRLNDHSILSSLKDIEGMERQRLQAIESLEISGTLSSVIDVVLEYLLLANSVGLVMTNKRLLPANSRYRYRSRYFR